MRVKNTMASKVCEGDSNGLNFYPYCIEDLMKEWKRSYTFDEIFEQVKKIKGGCLTKFQNQEELKDWISYFVYLFSDCKNIRDVILVQKELYGEIKKLSIQCKKPLEKIYKLEEGMVALLEREKSDFDIGMESFYGPSTVFYTISRNETDLKDLEKAIRFHRQVIMNRGIIKIEMLEEFRNCLPSIQCQGFHVKTGAFQEFIEKSELFAHQASEFKEYLVKMDSLNEKYTNLESELKSEVKKCEECIREQFQHKYAKCLCCVVLKSVRALKSFSQA